MRDRIFENGVSNKVFSVFDLTLSVGMNLRSRGERMSKIISTQAIGYGSK